MRNTLSKSVIINDSATYFRFLEDPKIEVSMIIPIEEHSVRIVYNLKKEYVEEHSTSNIIISLWTTSHAR